MSTQKRVTFDEEGQPTLTLTITGQADVFRFTWAMAHLQCDFADVARRIGGSLKRFQGAKSFAAMNKHYTGQLTHHWVKEDVYADER